MNERDMNGKEDRNGVAENRLLEYKKPQILFRQILEAVAGGCNPRAGGKDVVPDNCGVFASS